MTQNIENLRNDVEWLRSLAESGRNGPLQAGPYLVAGGAWFGGASLALALAQLRVLALPEGAESRIWMASALGFLATLAVLIYRDRHVTERGTNRLINAAWSAAGVTIFVYWLASSLLALRLDDGIVMVTMAPAVLSIYGLVWWIKGSLTGSGWMRALALVSFASVFVIALAVGSPYVWLSYTFSLLVTALLPGLYLVARSRQAR
jgi:hypothetical protein